MFVGALVYSQSRLEQVVREEIRSKELVVAVNKSLSVLLRAGAFGALERSMIMEKLKGRLGMATRWQTAHQQFRKDRLTMQSHRAATMNDVFDAWLQVRGLVGDDEKLKSMVNEISDLVRQIGEDFSGLDGSSSSPQISEEFAGLRVYSRLRRILPIG